jgi:hypothetical protein
MIHGGLSQFPSRYYLKYMKCNGTMPRVAMTILILMVVPPPPAVGVLAFTPLAAAPLVCAAPLTTAVASPCCHSIIFLSWDKVLGSAVLGLLLLD